MKETVSLAPALEVVEIVPPGKYQTIYDFSEGAAAVQDSAGKWGFINTSGQEIVPCRYKNVNGFSGGRAAVQNFDGKWGFAALNGEETIPCQYRDHSSFDNFSDGLARVANSDESGTIYSYINPCGKTAFTLSAGYSEAMPFQNGLAMVRIDDRYGLIDKNGREITPCKYQLIKEFSEGFAPAAVLQEGRLLWGFLDRSGREVIPCQYDGMGNYPAWEPEFHEGLAIVHKGNGYIAIDKTGRQAFSLGAYTPRVKNPELGRAYFQEGLAPVMRDGKYGFIDKTGKVAVPVVYDLGAFHYGDCAFRDGLAPVRRDNKWGAVDGTGREAVPCRYDRRVVFSEGLAAVEQNGKWGYVDRNGRLVIPCQYSLAYPFSEGLAPVEQGGRYGFIDTTGKLVIPCQYTSTAAFRKTGFTQAGLANQKRVLINRAGRVVSLSYDELDFMTDGLVAGILRERADKKPVKRVGLLALKVSAAPAADRGGGRQAG